MIPWWGWLLASYLAIGVLLAHEQAKEANRLLAARGRTTLNPFERLLWCCYAIKATVAWLPELLMFCIRMARHRGH